MRTNLKDRAANIACFTSLGAAGGGWFWPLFLSRVPSNAEGAYVILYSASLSMLAGGTIGFTIGFINELSSIFLDESSYTEQEFNNKCK